MNVGIMSMQRVVNYGSWLQAYGLKKEIESLEGCSVQFVDYLPAPSLVEEIKEHETDGIMKRLIRMLSPAYRHYRQQQLKLGKTFSEFYDAYSSKFLRELGVGSEQNYFLEVDVLVIGSDEVFNCTQPGEQVGYSLSLFGKDNRAKKLISYAASFGSTTIGKLNHYGIANEVGEFLKKFDALSVRDDNSVKIIQELCHDAPEKHIDPVLLYDFPEVNDVKINWKDYIVVYAYANRIGESEAKVIGKFAKEKGMKILTLGFWQPFADDYVLAEPIEVLAYIKNAAYVITDTFHGTVFSIKYQVPFAVMIRESNRQKLGDLLETFSLQERQALCAEDLYPILESPLRNDIQRRIKEKQAEARIYLRRELQGI